MLAGLDVIELSFSRNLGAEITASLRELFGLPAACGSKRPGHKIPERQRYKYRRVVAHVTAGAAWADAARAEGVDANNVKMWWARQKKARKPEELKAEKNQPTTKPPPAFSLQAFRSSELSLAAARKPAVPVLKPSGEIL
jgi:hypothetical protein